MSKRSFSRSYAGMVDFYSDVHGGHIVESRSIGSAGLIRVAQSAGDWSDPPTPDLVIGTNSAQAVDCTLDVGAGRFRTRIGRGTYLVTPPDSATSILIDGTHSYEGLAIPYARLLALTGDDMLPRDGNFGRLHRLGLSDDRLTHIFDHMWSEARSEACFGRLYSDGLLIQLAARLLQLRDQAEAPVKPGSLAPWQLVRIVEYIDAHLADDVALLDLARLIDLSPSHICRAFKQSSGHTPHAWLARRRVLRAQELMCVNRSMGLTEIALCVGYSSQSAFGTAFRRVTGTTPMAWRRERLS